MFLVLSLSDRIVVLTDEKEITSMIKRFQMNVKNVWCACVDASLPSFSIKKMKDGYLEAKNRGVEIKYITEITTDNLEYCKEIMTFAQLRHLDNVRGNFAVSESEYVAGVRSGDSLSSLVYSDVKELVEQQRLVFETLWGMAVPSRTKIGGIR